MTTDLFKATVGTVVEKTNKAYITERPFTIRIEHSPWYFT